VPRARGAKALAALRALLLATPILALATSAATAGAAPRDSGLAGTWRRDLARCRLAPPGAVPDPGRRDEIRLEGGLLRWSWTTDRPASGDTGTVRLAFDGRELRNRARGRSTTNVARWESDTLVVTTRGRRFGLGFEVTDRLWRAADGDTLHMRRRARLPTGTVEEDWVWGRVER
jgi:hypothetical protein